MRAVRQAASGLIYGLISLLLVIGSLSLALAQSGAPGIPVATFTPLPSSTSTPRPSPAAPSAAAASVTQRVTQSVTQSATTLPASVTRSIPTTTISAATATHKSICGAPYGWVRAYVVQPGDTLFRIAALHSVSVDALQRANCRSTTLIFVGEHLWVPFAGAVATELTIIPTFPTPTDSFATESAAPSPTESTPDP